MTPHNGYAVRQAPYQDFSSIVRGWAAESVVPRGTRAAEAAQPEPAPPPSPPSEPTSRIEAAAQFAREPRTVEARERAKRIGATAVRVGAHGLGWARREARLRRLNRQIEGEKAAIGRAVYPLLERGDLDVDLPDVRERMQKIAFLRARLTDEHQPRLT
jgi:hypothetical protein